MPGHDLSLRTAENYRVFATEARGRSPRYEELAHAVAGDPHVLDFLAALPAVKRPGVLPGTEVPERGAHGFILVRDGTEPVAVTDSHGTWLEWLG